MTNKNNSSYETYIIIAFVLLVFAGLVNTCSSDSYDDSNDASVNGILRGTGSDM